MAFMMLNGLLYGCTQGGAAELSRIGWKHCGGQTHCGAQVATSRKLGLLMVVVVKGKL